MSTLIDILKKAEEFLRKKNIPNSRFEAECILSKALKCQRIDLYLKHAAKLSDGQLADIRALLTRRANHEPLQYIFGEWPFHDLVLSVDPRVLIPRPETEELVELLIKKFSKYKDANLSILDIGTGSGAIALALAKYFRRSRVLASDFSVDALDLARGNAALNSIRSVTFVQSDWYASITGTFDLIVSNPPYLSEKEWEQTQPEIKNFEPKSALCAENEGRADLLKIIDQSAQFLKGNGVLALEIGELQHQFLLEFARTKFQLVEPLKDRALRNRFIILSRSRSQLLNRGTPLIQ
jgi:release factor glutamine methyltransferase